MASFTLNTGQARALPGFQNRTSDVFASLGGLEKSYDDKVKERGLDEFVEEEENSRDSPERDRGFKKPVAPLKPSGGSHRDHGRGHERESRFRRGRGFGPSSWSGEGQRSRRNVTPDYKLHPERWTEYSLEDTDVSSESGNKRAAVDFFRDLRARKAKEARTEDWDADLCCGKIEFKKPAAKSADEDSSRGEKTSSGSNVRKMPEYVIGQTKAKGGKAKSSLLAASGVSSDGAHSSKSDISLGHLGNEEDGEQPEAMSASSQTPGGAELSREAEGKTTEDSKADIEEEGVKEERVGFKKGKGKRKIRERREEDG